MNNINAVFSFVGQFCKQPVAGDPVYWREPAEVLESLREVWEEEVIYVDVLSPEVINDVLADLVLKEPERARATLMAVLDAAHQEWLVSWAHRERENLEPTP